MPLALLGIPLNVHLPPFWAENMGLSLATVGLILTAVRLLDIVIDPAIGVLSDRLGRRKPFIAAALPVALAGGYVLFFPPQGAGAARLFIGYAAVTLAWSLISLPWQAWGAELSDDYAERTRITAWRESFTLVGIVASAVLPAALGIVDPGTVLHVLSVVCFALALPAVIVLLVCVREPGRRGEMPHGNPIAALRSAWSNAAFRRLIAAWTVNGIANGMPAALFLLLCAHILRAPESAGPILLVYFLAGIAGVPLCTMVARRVGKHVAWCWAMLISCAAFLPVMALGAGDVGAFLAICVVTGLCLGADLALPPSMQADVVDLDALTSGQSRAGLFFAAWTMAQKAGNALAVGIAYGLLDLAGFSATGTNAAPQLWALAALYCLLPVLLKLVAVATMWRYPIDAAEQARIRSALVARAPA
jgi:Na+/melibiose symporter-like transporter